MKMTINALSPQKTCGNCKHRGDPIEKKVRINNPDFVLKETGFFLCRLIKHAGSITEAAEDFKEFNGDGAMIADGSGYYAALCVEEDFGCNRWEPLTNS